MTGSFNIKNASKIILSIMVAISIPSGIDAGYTMNETCNYIPKGYIGDPTDCQNWGYCQGGELIATGKCENGLLFDSQHSMCNYASSVTCLTTVQNACAQLKEPSYIADPNNCNSYCYCSNGAIQGCFNCPQYQSFNPNTNKCAWNKDYQCPANSICRLVGNNVFAEDPLICGNYLRCQDGSGTSQPCQTGNYNPKLGGCDANYDCSSNPANPPSENNIPQTNTKICNSYDAAGAAVQFFADDITCYGYYTCTSTSSVGQWGSCPFATHFNPNLQKCVTPYTYACPKNRCGNLNLQFVATVGCAGYTVCSNGMATSSDLCSEVAPGFPYFNEVGSNCQQDKPQMDVCA